MWSSVQGHYVVSASGRSFSQNEIYKGWQALKTILTCTRTKIRVSVSLKLFIWQQCSAIFTSLPCCPLGSLGPFRIKRCLSCPYLLLMPPSFIASRGLCIVTVVFPGYLHLYFCSILRPSHGKKKGKRKSRECHNHKPQPFPDPKRKRKPTNPNNYKRTKSTKIRSLFPKRGNRNTKRTEKTQEQNDTRKDIQRLNHKATKSKTNTWTTAFERSVEQTTRGL